MEDTASMLQDTLCCMETMFTGTIYQNMHGVPAPPYTLPYLQYASLLTQTYAPSQQQYTTPPPQCYAILLLQNYNTSISIPIRSQTKMPL
jgi:hypothetical protein